MSALDRTAGRMASLCPTTRRRRIALAISPALALLGLLVAPAIPARAAPTLACHYSDHVNMNVNVPSPSGTQTLFGQEFAGFYSGHTVIPSSTGVTAAGAEAQCLLKRAGFNPGTIDGVFGPNSQAAARAFQNHVDHIPSPAGLTVDGSVGPRTWPWLRWDAQ